MIIECPACSTRYNIKAKIPNEGRTVRCAKCGHIWRAKPLPEEEEHAGQAEAAANGLSSFAHDRPSPIGAQEHHEAAPRVEAVDGDSGDSETHVGDNESYFGNDSPFDRAEDTSEDGRNYFSEAEAFSPGKLEEEEEGEHPEAEVEAAAAAPDWDNESSAQGNEETKVSWFSTFLKRKNANAPDAQVRTAPPFGQSTANTIPFPRSPSGADLTRPGDDLRTLEEAREAVRDVFASLQAKPAASPSLSFQPGTHNAPESAAEMAPPEPQSAYAPWPSKDASASVTASEAFGDVTRWEEDTAQSSSTAGNVSSSAWADISYDSDGEESAAESHPWFKAWRDHQPEDESDPDSELRNALHAHFAAKPSLAETPQTPVEEPDTPDEGIQQSIIERFAASWKRPEEPTRQIIPDPETGSDEILDGGQNAATFDPQLYKEIEEASQPKKREGRGGLALAAAWGLFLCVASGLVVGLLAFRDIAAGAIPGLAGLYRTIGLPADVRPLALESVQYEWTSEDFNPVLVISGTVYNGGQRTLKLPEFTVTVKDNDPALDRDYAAELHLPNDEIAGGQRAEFQIELQSPSPSITAVELELSHVH